MAVLVLGTPSIANWIIRALARLGHDAIRPDRPLPSLSDVNATEKLRDFITYYSDQADLIHPGTHPWADRPELSLVAQEEGVSLVAPPARILSLFGNKLSLLTEAEKLGVPTLVADHTPLGNLREINRYCRERKLPLVLKSVRGVGGNGVCDIASESELEWKLPLWLEQLRKNFGEAHVFGEKYVDEGRYISLTFARLQNGETHFFPMIDASLQSRHRKILQFCPALAVDENLEKKIHSYSSKLLDHCAYVGVGTLEFLVDSERAFLIEGSARLNTSFHLWESVAETSAVEWQLATMNMIERPEVSAERAKKFGVSARLYAENSILQLPQPGKIREVSEKRIWELGGCQAELSLGVVEGEEVAPNDDGLLGEIYSIARSPIEALHLTRGVLSEFWIAGTLQTNQRFLDELLDHPWVREGIFHAGFVDEEFLPTVRPSSDILRTVLGVFREKNGDSATHRYAIGDVWVKGDGFPPNWSEPQTLQLSDGSKLRFFSEAVSPNRWVVRAGLWEMAVKRIENGEIPKQKVAALISGQVHSVLFREGATVPAHSPLVIVESLGTLVPHALPVAIKLIQWKVAPEQRVSAGEELADFEQV